MKTKWMIFLIFWSLLVSGAWAAGTTASVTVNGMVCPFCAQGITKKFKARPEVETVKVRLENQNVSLSFKDGLNISDEAITKILREAGYSVEKIERTST